MITFFLGDIVYFDNETFRGRKVKQWVGKEIYIEEGKKERERKKTHTHTKKTSFTSKFTRWFFTNEQN